MGQAVKKPHVKKGDQVMVITGKDKGKKAKVLSVIPEQGKLVVEGVAKAKKAVRPNPKNPQGGFMEVERPIYLSNVMPVCPSCGEPTRIRKRRDGDTVVRVCARCEGELS